MNNVIQVVDKTVIVNVQQEKDDIVEGPPYTYGVLQYSGVTYGRLATKRYGAL